MSFLSRLNVPFLTIETRRRLSENDRRWHVKLAFRLAATVLSLIAFSLFAAAIPTWNANFFHVAGPSKGDWQDGMPIAAVSHYYVQHSKHVSVRQQDASWLVLGII